jgi:hypothetical protein
VASTAPGPLPSAPLPSRGEVFLDARGDDRSMRVSWHPEAGLVVLSLWRGNVCAASFRLAAEEVPALVSALLDSVTSSATHDRVG